MKLRALINAARVAAIVYLGGTFIVDYDDLNFPCVALPVLSSNSPDLSDPLPRFKKALAYQGLFARVGRQLGVSRGHVYNVATGERGSGRVIAALLSEIDRVEEGAMEKSFRSPYKGAPQ